MSLNDIRVGLQAYLMADAGIAAAVGNERIYPVKLPQGQLLASIVYNRVSGVGDHHMQGPSGLAQVRIQIDCWAKTIDAASTLADQVKEHLDGFQGSMSWGDNSPEEAIRVQGVFFDSEREDFDDAVKLYRVSRDYFFWYEER